MTFRLVAVVVGAWVVGAGCTPEHDPGASATEYIILDAKVSVPSGEASDFLLVSIDDAATTNAPVLGYAQVLASDPPTLRVSLDQADRELVVSEVDGVTQRWWGSETVDDAAPHAGDLELALRVAASLDDLAQPSLRCWPKQW